MTDQIPTVDLADWKTADEPRRRQIAREIDASLSQTGAFLLRQHGVPADLIKRTREEARNFFNLPAAAKQACQMTSLTDNGWQGIGTLTPDSHNISTRPPDLFEAFHAGAPGRGDDAELDAVYFPANRWPRELPSLQPTVCAYTTEMSRVARDVLEMLAAVLEVDEDLFTAHAQRPTWTQNLNWYPSFNTVSEAREGQMRVGQHTDFGTITLLHREQGVGGLQMWNEQHGWFDPPHDDGTLTVILGDLMHVWTDGRWTALRHRVLGPSALASDEELISLVFFYEADPEAIVTPLAQPHGAGRGLTPIVAGEYVRRLVTASY